MRRPSTSTRPTSAKRAWPSARVPSGCRCCMRTWWAGRTRSCSTAPRSRVDAAGPRARARAPAFESRDLMLEIWRPTARRAARVAPVPALEAQAWAALVTGVRDYLGKNGFPGAIIGLSGGIDSALVLAMAVDALGADRVRTVMMPSPYTADISWIDAREMAGAAGRALRRDRHRADVRRLPRQPGAAVRRPGRRHDRREPAGAHPRHAADGAVQQDRRHRADHRQQERDGHRLLHAVRRHGRRLCRHQGRGQDPGLPPGEWKNRAADAACRWQRRAR